MQTYQAGHIKLTNGSDMVEGFGTAWNTYSRAGDSLIVGNDTYLITEVLDNHLLKIDAAYTGETVSGVKYVIERQPIVETLDQIKAAAAARVDQLAGKVRLKYTTTSPGQEMTYISKLADAKAYIAAGYPSDVSPYAWIDAESAATGGTPTQVADLIVYTANLWITVGAQIEGHRQAAKQAISAATAAAQVLAAEDAFVTAMSAL